MHNIVRYFGAVCVRSQAFEPSVSAAGWWRTLVENVEEPRWSVGSRVSFPLLLKCLLKSFSTPYQFFSYSGSSDAKSEAMYGHRKSNVQTHNAPGPRVKSDPQNSPAPELIFCLIQHHDLSDQLLFLTLVLILIPLFSQVQLQQRHVRPNCSFLSSCRFALHAVPGSESDGAFRGSRRRLGDVREQERDVWWLPGRRDIPHRGLPR